MSKLSRSFGRPSYPTLPVDLRRNKIDNPAALPPLADLALIDVKDDSILTSISPPVKRIYLEEDVQIWQRSHAHHQLLLFLAQVAQACIGKATVCPQKHDTQSPSAAVLSLIELLERVDALTQEIKPLDTPQRFGNLAFRTWGQRLEEEAEGLHKQLLPSELHAFIPELAAYFLGAFGSFVRLDYGSGHELSFAAWLCFLRRLGFLHEGDEEAIGLRIIPRYLQVVWNLQDAYKLEPAGSHGVWGLDDYQFVPYIVGAAQLAAQDEYRPSQISSVSHRAVSQTQKHVPPQDLLAFVPNVGPASMTRNSAPLRSVDGPSSSSPQPTSRVTPESPPPFANLFTSSIARIHLLKKGPFAEHSPLLNDLSGSVPNWVKMHNGMLKMYDAECLGKRPVVQHFLFGPTCFKWEGPVRQPSTSNMEQTPRPNGCNDAPADAPNIQVFSLTGAPWAAQPPRMGIGSAPRLPPLTIAHIGGGSSAAVPPPSVLWAASSAPHARTGVPIVSPVAAPWTAASSRVRPVERNPTTLGGTSSAAIATSPFSALPPATPSQPRAKPGNG
ncbi:PTPA-domain-containing protein [Tilletiaria anomala UBC 951]|uniref:Serine/threonine-protein phosphatase 2A activator n=1 Tax=Tilletiaria anomala (strain ATCC 24038 / CBS 436.72 / UBC 951) TaxID=1037660 RepID=A0A066WK70_TILAU|nr:PTPA-domain-containing protein [Tilletiaria anomala UBC 951]KDN52963.1 PTPA-domain-containing protein [Tilletiaria anomala UBC 951]